MDLQTEYWSEISRQYDKAKKAASDKVRLDAGRVDRAYALVKSENYGAKILEYSTNINNCLCPDFQLRTSLCKHRLAFVFNWRAIQHVMALIDVGQLEVLYDVLA